MFERDSWCVMDLPGKPSCYDAVPACLCTSCQLYDAVCAKSSSVSSSFLPARYAASLYSSPADSCEVSCVLSTRPSCSVADSTCGLASIVPPRRLCRPRRCFEFAVSSPPFMLPVSSAAVPAVSSSSDAVPSGSVLPSPASSVQTSAAVVSSSDAVLPSPASSVQTSAAVVSSSSLLSTPVPASCPVSYASSRARPVPVWSRAVPPSRPFRSVAPPFRPVAPPLRLMPGPLFLPRSLLFPVACFVLVTVTVLLSSPFGFVLSFLPLLR